MRQNTRLFRMCCKIACAVLIFALFFTRSRETLAEFEVHFLNVGQGDAAILLCDRQVMMIDGGKPDSSQFIYSYLTKTLGLSHIDILVATHPHADHVGGLSAALSACEVDLVLSPVYYYNDPVFLSFRDMVAKRNLGFLMPLAGTTMAFGSATVTFLAPARLYGDTNDNSLMMRIEYGDTSFLFTGDAEIPEEQEALEAFPEKLHADVLKVGHHGSSSSTGEAFLKAVHPGIALIGVGVANTYGHPSVEVLGRIHAMGTEIYRTDLHGTIVLTSDGQHLSVKTEMTPENEESIYSLTWASFLASEQEDHPVAAYYVGNAKSMKFHLPECEGAIKMNEKNRVHFDTRNEAIQAGYHPCGTCNP